ncbi:MAG: PhoH family protein [Anaerococcus sp.]|uniref:PhoH family protein n=1 Tax=Anaerococcus sp. TaxID=1872515 RepID=UPI002618A02F|nr:PhoH family protein [Anaerococcus sp.]MCI5971899.1 PhoH family protein [Anaerococcus sp.]MDD6918379.1 PhoH family protein [Peptoniphilaceae bacterium]MDY2928632.1 PhoH family protein [Anaerococcus sp.]
MSLFGSFDKNRKYIEERFDTKIKVKDNDLEIKGEELNTKLTKDLLEQLLTLISKGESLDFQKIKYHADMLERENKDVIKGLLGDVIVTRADGKPIKPKTLGQKSYIEKIRNNDVVFGIGPAGTGKTYLAVAMAVRAFKAGEVDRIILTRPAVEAGESLGFLPGDLQDKVDPYLRPLYDGLFDILGFDTYQNLVEKGLIEVAPLAYMRGRTLDRSFVILDEAQNTTHEQMKMFLTRLGFGSKAIITGDKTQVDLPRGKKSGIRAAEHILRNVEGIAFMEFSSIDVVRHPLVQRIIDAYDKEDARRMAERKEKEANSKKE